LLAHLIQNKGHSKRRGSLLILLAGAVLMIISLAGPTWSKLPVPTYKHIQPRVLILDLSDEMMVDDLSPNRLIRAKFKLHDLLNRPDVGQLSLIVYSGEPFVVSPLTDDGQTIDALLSSLTTDIMPVQGQRLDSALEEAGKLIQQAGFNQGEVLVLTSTPPSTAAINAAGALAHKDVHTSVMPVLDDANPVNPLFQRLAQAGGGAVIPFADTAIDLDQWLTASSGKQQFSANLQNDMPVWRDQGRWFLVPALLCLLPVFRRGWLQRINT